VITGQPGSGKTVALAYLASLAANRDPALGKLSEAVPFFYHIADLRLPGGEIKGYSEPYPGCCLATSFRFGSCPLNKFLSNMHLKTARRCCC